MTAINLFPMTATAATRSVQLTRDGRLREPIGPIKAGDVVTFCLTDLVAEGRWVDVWFVSESTGAIVATPVGVAPAAPAQVPSCSANPPTLQIHIVDDSVRVRYRFNGPIVELTDGQREARDVAAAALPGLEMRRREAVARLKDARAQVDRVSDELKAFAGAANAEGTRAIVARLAELQRLKLTANAISDEVDDIAQQKADAEETAALTRTQPVFRDGSIVVGASRKVAYYHLARDGSADHPVYLEHIGAYPVLVRDDELFAVINDAKAEVEPTAFVLTSSSATAAPPDPAPLRPSSDPASVAFQKQARIAAAALEPLKLDFRLAYRDVVLTLGRPLEANEIVTLNISTYVEAVTSDKTTGDGSAESEKREVVKERTSVRVLDSAVLPQVHSVYYYNLATGVLVSSLRDATFTKNKTTVGTPAVDAQDATATSPAVAAMPAVPDTFTVTESPGDRRVFPVLLFSIYWQPKDIQLPFGWADLIPVPTVGFSLTSPADNFFAGFSSEIRRNVQLVYGWHWGKTTRRGAIPVDETTTSTAPSTIQAFGDGKFVGVTFNINFVKDLFK